MFTVISFSVSKKDVAMKLGADHFVLVVNNDGK